MNYQTLPDLKLLQAFEDECRWRNKMGEKVALDMPVLTALTLHAALRDTLATKHYMAEFQAELQDVLNMLDLKLNRTPAIAEAHRRGAYTQGRLYALANR